MCCNLGGRSKSNGLLLPWVDFQKPCDDPRDLCGCTLHQSAYGTTSSEQTRLMRETAVYHLPQSLRCHTPDRLAQLSDRPASHALRLSTFPFHAVNPNQRAPILFAVFRLSDWWAHRARSALLFLDYRRVSSRDRLFSSLCACSSFNISSIVGSDPRGAHCRRISE